jgi:arginase
VLEGSSKITKPIVEIWSASCDLGGSKLGSRLGPDAMRLCRLAEAIASQGYPVQDRGDVGAKPHPEMPGGLKGFSTVFPLIERLRLETERALQNHHLPLILCGEHTLSAGGISAAANCFRDDFRLLWIDAHADVNTPESSGSGNLHGMPLAALQGLNDSSEPPIVEEWTTLVKSLGPIHLAQDQIGWFGLRDVDANERPRVKRGFSATMNNVDRFGVEASIFKLLDQLCQGHPSKLWISFDVDVLDPVFAPGTGTAVRGGLTYREAHLLAELIRERTDEMNSPIEIVGIDVVEVNPLADSNNQTAIMATEWIASLLGKTIL